MSRDWTQTLWPSSFNGVAFWVERNADTPSRRIAVHDIPKSDTPFLEDMGANARRIAITAYLTGDTADSDSDGLTSVLMQEGVGTLMLPAEGSVQARYQTGTRNFAKDKLGYIAFDLTFVEDLGGSPLVTVPYLAQLGFDACDALAIASGDLVNLFDLAVRPGWVVNETVAALQDIPATFEVIRSQNPVDPAQSNALAGSIAGFYNSIPTLVSQAGVDPSIISTSFELASALAAALPEANAESAFALAYQIAPIPVAGALIVSAVPGGAPLPALSGSAGATRAGNVTVSMQILRLSLLAGATAGALTRTYTTRDDGVAARSALVAAYAQEAAQIVTPDSDLVVALSTARDAVVAYITKAIADLSPIVTVAAPRSMPSLWWAWRLYQDPSRAAELIARNDLPHASFCSTQLQALAPDAKANPLV